METTTHYIDIIDRQIAARNLLSHPFYQSWTKGTLPRTALEDYARQYYHHVAAFPTYLSAVHSRCDDQETRLHLLANLMDEEAGRPNHPDLWVMFAGALGQEKTAVQSVSRHAETEALIERFRRACSGDTASGIAALYAYESQIPAVAEAKIDGLNRFYGIDTPAGTAYFKVHIEADKEHSAVERNLLARYINEETLPAAQEAVGEVTDALWEMLSGICRRHNIDC